VQASEGGEGTGQAQLPVPPTALCRVAVCISQGFFSLVGGFDDNGEGLDKNFCIHFYSRFKFVTELAPLLQVEVRISNGLVPEFQDTTYNDLAIEVSFCIHMREIYPGFVKTPIVNGSRLNKIIGTIFGPLATSPAVCNFIRFWLPADIIGWLTGHHYCRIALNGCFGPYPIATSPCPVTPKPRCIIILLTCHPNTNAY